MKRLFSFLTGKTTKIQANEWLHNVSIDALKEKTELIVDQSSKIILSTIHGQVSYTYNAQSPLEYYSEDHIIIRDNKSLELNKITNIIVTIHDKLIAKSIELLKQDIPQTQPANGSDEQQLKSIEWLKVSLTVLSNAIDHCLRNNDLAYSGYLYVYDKGDDQYQIHLTSMSLSFIIVFRNNGVMQISCWNNKEDKPDFHKKPDMSMQFTTLKNQAFDLFIPLLVKTSKISTQGLQ